MLSFQAITETNQHPLGLFDQQRDVGTVSHAGACHYDAGQQRYAISGSGANIWGDHDDFHFVWKRLSGNFIVTARAHFIGEGWTPTVNLAGWCALRSIPIRRTSRLPSTAMG